MIITRITPGYPDKNKTCLGGPMEGQVRSFEVNWKDACIVIELKWKIMRDENKLLSHHLAKAIKYLENIVYPLWEPRLVLMDLTPRFISTRST